MRERSNLIMKYCLHCGRIYAESYDEYDKDCIHDGFKLIEDTDMTEEQFLKLSESEKDEYELKIYNICKQSEFFDESAYIEQHDSLSNWYFTFRFDKYEQLTGEKACTKENEAYYKMQAHKRVSEAMAKYAGTINSNSSNNNNNNNKQVKCPNCGSTSITAGQSNFPLFTGFIGPSITIGEIDFPLFTGMIGSGKTVNRCANCGHKWKP